MKHQLRWIRPQGWLFAALVIWMIADVPGAAAQRSSTSGRSGSNTEARGTQTASETDKNRKQPVTRGGSRTTERTERQNERTTRGGKQTTEDRSVGRTGERTERRTERTAQRNQQTTQDRSGGRTDERTSDRVSQRTERTQSRTENRRHSEDRRDTHVWQRNDRRIYVHRERHVSKHFDVHVHHPGCGHYHFVDPFVHINIDIHWPWERRYSRGWSPRYGYRQAVYMDVGWGRRQRTVRLEMRTIYRHRVIYANRHRAKVEVDIEGIELYENGHFLGEVRHIPNSLARTQATLYRNGTMDFDREIFLIGDPHEGFEIISTRYYDGHVLDHYHRAHGYRAGRLDLRRERVYSIGHSRLFDPYDFNGFVPLALLPESEVLWDYGADYGYGYQDYGTWGYGTDHPSGWHAPRQQTAQPDRRVQVVPPARGSTSGRVADQAVYQREATQSRHETRQSFRTQQGADIQLKREVQLERLDDQ